MMNAEMVFKDYMDGMMYAADDFNYMDYMPDFDTAAAHFMDNAQILLS